MRIAIIALLCTGALSVFAQQSSPWALNIQLFHQDNGIDASAGSLGVTDRVWLRPGFTAGLERTWLEGKRVRLFQDLHTGLWRNTYAENYAFVGTRLGLDVRVFRQLRLTPGFLYRYGSVKPRDVRYVYEEGKWVPANNSTPRFRRQTLAVDAQVSWRFGAASAHPVDLQLGVDYQFAWKFLPVEFTGNFFLYRAFRVGVRYGL